MTVRELANTLKGHRQEGEVLVVVRVGRNPADTCICRIEEVTAEHRSEIRIAVPLWDLPENRKDLGRGIVRIAVTEEALEDDLFGIASAVAAVNGEVRA